MIRFFKVRNYASIKDLLTISFIATNISEHTDSNIVDIRGEKLLKSILLYGHNASGKSNILAALVFFRWLIINSATKLNSKSEIDVEPFLLDEETESSSSFFEMGFVLESVRYRYGFEVRDSKIEKEWLLEAKKKKEYPIYLRIKDEFEIDERRFKGAASLQDRTKDNTLFLSVCEQWNVKKAKKILGWFDSMYTVHGLMDTSYREETIKLMKNSSYANIVVNLLRKADLGISYVELLDIPLEQLLERSPLEAHEMLRKRFGSEHQQAIITHHDKKLKSGETTNQAFLMEKHESDGTQKFFNLIGVYVNALRENRFVVVDEFDARLHTLLTKSILGVFNSAGLESRAQLIAASHDTALLDRDLLRRDQIYFVEKDKSGGSNVTSLVEYKPRKESPYDRNYLNGRYGGIPFIEDLEGILISKYEK